MRMYASEKLANSAPVEAKVWKKQSSMTKLVSIGQKDNKRAFPDDEK